MIGQVKNTKLDMNDLRKVLESSNRWIYSKEDYIALLNMFIEHLNKNSVITPLKTVVYEDTIYIKGAGTVSMPQEKKKNIVHKYDIEVEKRRILLGRERDTDPLTPDEVETIQRLFKDKYSKAEIAKVFGLSRNTVHKYCK